jgi:response regulator NasT
MRSMPSADRLRVLIIDRDAERSAIVARALHAQGHRVVGHRASTLHLYDQVQRLEPDVIVIDTESPDRDTLEHICLLTERTPRPVVLFTDEHDNRIIREAVRAGVTAYIVDGLAAERVVPIVHVAMARFEAFESVKAERDSAQAKLAERKLVERAKGLLMSKRGMSEDEAYRALRRMAMENKLRLVEIAERVVSLSHRLS